jgi:single-strand DNA-binding protein
VNKVVLIGRLTANPELKHTPAGTAVTKFTLAVDRRQAKDREKETDFIDVVVWQKQAENCANYSSKGKLAAVDGRLQLRSYDDSQGVRRKVAEVVAELCGGSAQDGADEYLGGVREERSRAYFWSCSKATVYG